MRRITSARAKPKGGAWRLGGPVALAAALLLVPQGLAGQFHRLDNPLDGRGSHYKAPFVEGQEFRCDDINCTVMGEAYKIAFRVDSVAEEFASRTDTGGAAPLDGELVRPLPQEIRREIAEARAVQLAGTEWTTLVVPFYSIAGLDRAILFLMNGSGGELELSVEAVNPAGQGYPLGSYFLLAQSHVELDLNEALAEASPTFTTGSLRAVLLGPPGAAQGWIAQRRGGTVQEIPLAALPPPAPPEGAAVRSYWDLRLVDATHTTVRFHIVNPWDSPLPLQAIFLAGGDPIHEIQRTLAPRTQAELSPPPGKLISRGVFELRADGGEDLPLFVGFVETESSLVKLPTFGQGYDLVDSEYFSMDTLLGPSGSIDKDASTSLWITLFNLSYSSQTVHVSLLDHFSGSVLGEAPVLVEGAQIVTSALDAELPPIFPGSLPARIRLRVSGESLLAPPIALLHADNSQLAQLAFFPAASVHPGGRYPVPRLDENETWTSIVNLGEEMTQIVAQLFWTGGTYSLGPIDIPPGGSTVLNFRQIIAEAEPDLLERTPDPDLPHAFIQWSFRSGSPKLIARTHVRPLAAFGAFGFNCFNCCYQLPIGIVVPQEVDFLAGQDVAFQAAVIYDTCDGQLGPFSTDPHSLDVPPPFYWDGTIAGAWDAGNEGLAFKTFEWKITVTCQNILSEVPGMGRARTCAEHLRKSSNPLEFWKLDVPCYQQTNMALQASVWVELVSLDARHRAVCADSGHRGAVAGGGCGAAVGVG